jgi:Uma2 family endonuclease
MPTPPSRIADGPAKLTYEDYLQLPDDGIRYEILDGELEMTPAPTTTHQRVSRNLHFVIHGYLQATGFGEILAAPTDVVLAPTTVVEPDLVYVAAERAGMITVRAIEGAPDLLVEILSPSTARRDRQRKAALYARLGVRFYWIVDPDARTLEEYERTAQGSYRPGAVHTGPVTVRTACFPDLAIDLSRVWA